MSIVYNWVNLNQKDQMKTCTSSQINVYLYTASIAPIAQQIIGTARMVLGLAKFFFHAAQATHAFINAQAQFDSFLNRRSTTGPSLLPISDGILLNLPCSDRHLVLK